MIILFPASFEDAQKIYGCKSLADFLKQKDKHEQFVKDLRRNGEDPVVIETTAEKYFELQRRTQS